MKLNGLPVNISEDNKLAALLKQCYLYSKQSNHPSTHNAAILVKDDKMVLYGLNNLPPGVSYKEERFAGKNKHKYPNHAERDVIYKAAKKGIAADGLTMIMPWLPCVPCANAIITSGVKKLVVHKQMIERTDEDWQEELKEALHVMHEAGVEVVAYDGVVGAKAYMHSQEWEA